MQLTAALRRAFREPPPDALEIGFSALRTVSKVTSWLTVNHRLHELSEQNAPVEAGALAIAEAIEQLVDRAAPAGPSSSECVAILDDLAADARRRMERGPAAASSSRLRTLVCVNESLLGHGGFNGVLPGAGPAESVDVASGSSLSRVLRTRRGLPILLCTVYHAVAARLGLRLEFTNFPNCVLLRLDAEPGSNPSADGGDDGSSSCSGSRDEAAAGDFYETRREGEGGEEGDEVWVSDLSGLWIAEAGSLGPELVEVCVRGGEVEATKLTGDEHVPAGEVSWRACAGATPTVAAEPDPLAAGLRLRRGVTLNARVTVAEKGFVNARSEDAAVQVHSRDSLSLLLGVLPPQNFARAHDKNLWFVDPFNKGKILPADTCCDVLRRLGIPDEEHHQYTIRVDPRRVWARMLRNLMLWHHRRGDTEGAHHWYCVAHGLEPNPAVDLD